MNEAITKRSKEVETVKDHRAVNIIYKRAIIRAIDELQDFNLRSNIDAIRRHVQSTLQGPEHVWNDTVFLKTLKSLANEGDIEQVTVNCGLSPEFKQRRTKSMNTILEKRSQRLLHHQRESGGDSTIPLPPQLTYPYFTHPPSENHEKTHPARKLEHVKPYKIIPKKIYDSLHVPIKNPMDTH